MKSARTAIGAVVMLSLAVFAGCAGGPVETTHAHDESDHDHDGETPISELVDAIATSATLVTHIHGLGYSQDGRTLLVAAHDGLKAYFNGMWAPLPATHDFMGFSAVEGGFFSSGHPSPLSDLPNPLGVVFVTDTNWDLSILGFGGEFDFHHFAAGYFSHTLFMFNSQPTDRLESGLHRSVDRGESWERRRASGVSGQLRQLAAHPTDPMKMALATSSGVFVSDTGGESGTRRLDGSDFHAVSYTLDGSALIAGGAILVRLDGDGQVQTILPSPGSNEIVAYITASPVNPDELVVATDLLNIYRSEDGGDSWNRILSKGREE
jgi:hypothetical protein